MAKSQIDTFKNLPTDGSRKPIQIGNSFQTFDATGTPQNSPLAFSTVEIPLVVPDGAAELIVNPSTDMQVSEVLGGATYDVVAANTKESFPCAGMSTIYIIRDSADGTVNFRFTII